VLKYHGGRVNDGYPVCNYGVVMDNDFQYGGVWPVAIGPQDEQQDERIQDVLVERNVFRSDSSTQTGLRAWTSYATIRNNLCLGDGASQWYTAISVSQRGIEPRPTGNKVMNNTFYRADSGSQFRCIDVSGSAQNTVVRNNFGSAPGTSGAEMMVGGGSGLVADHNVMTSQPRFSSPESGDFSLRSGSPAIDCGYDVGLPFDCDGQPRFDDPGTPDTGDGGIRYYDLGAFEYQG